jgi:PIN domain nuclease of toxin-antitoxin system
MKFLLDTHVLLWWLENPETLSEEAKSAIQNSENTIYVSAATAWEIAIKKAIGKLDAPDDLGEAVAVCRFLPLDITIEHAWAVRQLPAIHRDPFDRMLIAQCNAEGLTIVSRDSEIFRYSVPHLRA